MWVAGFISGDGSFNLSIRTRKNNNLLGSVSLIFGVCMHIREESLVKGLIDYLYFYASLRSGAISSKNTESVYVSHESYTSEVVTTLPEAGRPSPNQEKILKNQYYKSKTRAGFNFRRLSDIVNLIIPFFDKYPIQGYKRLDFEDFKKISDIIINKKHLTVEGFELVKKINSRMNLRRPW